MMNRLGLSAVIFLVVTSAALAAVVPLGTMPSWTTSEQNIYSTGMIWRDCNRDGLIDVFFSNGNDMDQAANNLYLAEPGDCPRRPPGTRPTSNTPVIARSVISMTTAIPT